MAGEPIVARTAWSKGGTTYVTIRWNGAIRTRVARRDGTGVWTITLPGLGDTAVVLPATIDSEPTEGRLARGATMAARLFSPPPSSAPVSLPPPLMPLPPSTQRDDTHARLKDDDDADEWSEVKTLANNDDDDEWSEVKPLEHDDDEWSEVKSPPAAGPLPPPLPVPRTRREETQAPVADDGDHDEWVEVQSRTLSRPELERHRAQAEWQRIEEERRRLERDRKELEEQRRLLAAASKPAPPPPKPDQDLPAWLRALPDPDRYVFQHLVDHGSINETEATKMLGGARQFRRFSVQLEEHLARVPFKVRIEMSGDIKCYVREGGTE